MSKSHDHHDHPHGSEHHEHTQAKQSPAPVNVTNELDDAGSKALSDALKSSFLIVKFVMVGLLVLFFASGLFTVPSQQKAIILRFGKPVGTGPEQLLGAGLHWSFPYPIDEIVKIPIGEIQRITSSIGWYATTPEMEATKTEQPPGPSLNPMVDGYTITGDGNVIHVRITTSYRIADPLSYVLNFVNASNVVQHLVDSALIHVSSQFKVDEALTQNKVGFQEKLMTRIRQEVETKGLGITIEQGEVQIIPPRYLKGFFDQAFSADIERRKTNEVARAYASRVLSTASGEANAILNNASTDRTRLVQAVAAEASYFKNQLPHYEANKELFMTRLQTEAFGRALTNVQDKIFLPRRNDGKPRELRLQLGREPKVPGVPQPIQP